MGQAGSVAVMEEKINAYRLSIKLFCAIGNTQIRTIPTYCQGVYHYKKKYKSFSNMFRLIHAAVFTEYT